MLNDGLLKSLVFDRMTKNEEKNYDYEKFTKCRKLRSKFKSAKNEKIILETFSKYFLNIGKIRCLDVQKCNRKTAKK